MPRFSGIVQDRGLGTGCIRDTGGQRLRGDAVVLRSTGWQANGQPCQRQCPIPVGNLLRRGEDGRVLCLRPMAPRQTASKSMDNVSRLPNEPPSGPFLYERGARLHRLRKTLLLKGTGFSPYISAIKNTGFSP